MTRLRLDLLYFYDYMNVSMCVRPTVAQLSDNLLTAAVRTATVHRIIACIVETEVLWQRNTRGAHSAAESQRHNSRDVTTHPLHS